MPSHPLKAHFIVCSKQLDRTIVSTLFQHCFKCLLLLNLPLTKTVKRIRTIPRLLMFHFGADYIAFKKKKPLVVNMPERHTNQQKRK